VRINLIQAISCRPGLIQRGETERAHYRRRAVTNRCNDRRENKRCRRRRHLSRQTDREQFSAVVEEPRDALRHVQRVANKCGRSV